MNQPHPPLPDYRPERTPDDPAEPRTQSILMPPELREGGAHHAGTHAEAEPVAPLDAPVATAGEPAADPAPAVEDALAEAPDESPEAPATEEPSTGATGATAASATDFRPDVGPGPAFAPGAGAPPPLPGPPTGPAPDWSPPGWAPPGAEQPTEQPTEQPSEETGSPAAAEAPATQVTAQLTTPVDFVPGPGDPAPAPEGTPAPPAAPGPQAPLPPPRSNAPWPVPGPTTRPGPQAAAQPAPPSPRPRPSSASETGVFPAAPAGRTRDVGALGALALGVVGLALVELGLVLDLDGRSLWSALPTWSAFATVAALVGLVPALLRVLHRDPLGQASSWRAGAVGAAALLGFWVLIVLPVVATDRGFLLTLGAAATAAAVWVTPGRPAARS